MALTSSVHTSHTADLRPANLDRACLNFKYIETQLDPTFPFISNDPINVFNTCERVPVKCYIYNQSLWKGNCEKITAKG